MPRAAAFTLVELMVAITLSMGILVTATVGVRIGLQSVSAINHLSTENALISSGLTCALDEIDFWTAYDDPVDPTKTSLRGTGMPFVPFSTAFPKSGAFSGDDSDRGWDAAYSWPANDARTWWCGNNAERCATTNDLRMGMYNRFFCTVASNATGEVPTHTWLPNQLRGLITALGYQGLCEYMPANTLYAYYMPISPFPGGGTGYTQTSPGGMCNSMCAGWFNCLDGHVTFPNGLSRLSFNFSYALAPLSPLGGIPPTITDYTRLWATDRDASESSIQKFHSFNLSRHPLLATWPVLWPKVRVSVLRYTSHCRFPCICAVEWTDPLSGVAHSLSFSAIGTTLRGARMQRRSGPPGAAPGWARWVGKDDPSNDTTLDSY